MKKSSKLLTVLTALLTTLFSLSAALALPMLWRGWYYIQIDALDLPARTGWKFQVIREAFDQVMDYLLLDTPFGTGSLAWSESGMAHFADCKVLFRLDLLIFAASGALLLLLFAALLLSRSLRGRFGISPPLLALCVMAAVVLALGIWAAVDFEGLFTAFHALCFPGKDNWVFDYRTDQIILILPEEFWARTAALCAGAAAAIQVALCLIWQAGAVIFRPKNVYEELKTFSA